MIVTNKLLDHIKDRDEALKFREHACAKAQITYDEFDKLLRESTYGLCNLCHRLELAADYGIPIEDVMKLSELELIAYDSYYRYAKQTSLHNTLSGK